MGVTLLVGGCASMEHSARQSQGPILNRTAEHFRLAAADASQAAVQLDRVVETALEVKGIGTEHLRGFRETELSLRFLARILSDADGALSRARLPLSREQVVKFHAAARQARTALAGLAQGIEDVRLDVRESTAAHNLSAEEQEVLAAVLGHVDGALDSVESMVGHADAAVTELERLEA